MYLSKQQREAKGNDMNMSTLVEQSLEQASKLTGKPVTDKETQEVAFKLSCAAMAAELA
jgi:hypothetical protein